MRHLRQILLVIVVLLAMYLLEGATAWLLLRVIFPGQYDLYVFADRVAFFLWALLAGAVLMRLLTWRFRVIAMLAIPVLLLLIVPIVAYVRVRSYFDYDFSYMMIWPYYAYLALPVLGMIVGAVLSARLAR